MRLSVDFAGWMTGPGTGVMISGFIGAASMDTVVGEKADPAD